MDNIGGANQVAEGVTYFILWSILVFWSIWTIRRLMQMKRSEDVRKIQPFYVSVFMVLALIGIFLYSIFQVFDQSITWKTLSCVTVVIFSSLEAIVGLMVLEYFTDIYRIEMLAKFLERRTKRSRSVPSTSVATPRSGNLYQIKTKLVERSVCFKSAFVTLISAFGSAPVLILANVSSVRTTFFQQSIVVQDKPWVFLTFFIGCMAAFSFVAIMIWIHCRMKSLGKSVSFWEILRKYVITGFFAGVIAIVIYATPLAEWSHETFDFKPLLIVFLPYVFLLVSLTRERPQFKLVHHMSPRSLNSISVGSEGVLREELISTLNDAEGYQLIFQAARKELSLENLMFYTTIQDWKAIREPELKQARAKYICECFFTSGSDCLVNVSYKSKVAISEKINLASDQVPSDVFDDALQEILKLILWDTYMRVRSTKEFVEYCKNRTA